MKNQILKNEIKLNTHTPTYTHTELRDRLGTTEKRLHWYGHVLQKEDSNWVKKCMEYEVEGVRPRGRPKKTWTKVVQKNCQACELHREDATDCNRWRKQIRDDR